MDDKDAIIARLTQENNYLKGLLEQHGISYEPRKEIIQHDLDDVGKISAYLSYFIGRDDIFAFEYYSKEGKRMFMPACSSRPNLTGYCPYKCSECNHKQYLGINEATIKRHLLGKDTFGIYPLLKGDLCQLLAFDFDEEDYQESALAFSLICHKHHLDNLIEISSSGCGAHVWLFFESPILASKARRLGTHLLFEAMDEVKGISFASLDRMFPSQDHVPVSGYGNLIVLPLQGKKAKEHKTVFVDHNFIPYELKNQINVLLSTKKISEAEVDALLESYKDNDPFACSNKNILANIKLNRNDVARTIHIIKRNDILVPKAALNNRSLKFLYRLGSVINPEYYKAQQQRRSVYNISRIQVLYREDESFIYLPRGCYDDLLKVLNYLGAEVIINDHQTSGEMILVSFKGQLKDYQQDGLDRLLKYDHGLFVARPSFGKTVVAIALIAELKLNTLIIVPNLALLKQWISRLDEFLDVMYPYSKDKDRFGVYYGARKKLSHKIDVACIDSLVGEEATSLFSSYGVIIFDEVHHIGATSYEQVVRRCSSKYLYGFTATPKRSDKNDRIIIKTIGDIRFQYKDIEDGLDKVLVPEFTFFTFSRLDKETSYADLLTALLMDDERNTRISNDIHKSYHEGRNILVLTDRIEHIKELQSRLSDLEHVFIINGQLKEQEKRRFFENLSKVKRGFVILSTGKYIGEGFDEKRLDTLFLVSPFRWKGTLEQYVGRLHRHYEGKKQVEVHDYIDINVRMFANMYHHRLRGYRSLGYILNGEGIIYEKKIYGPHDYYKKLQEDIAGSKQSAVFIIDTYDEDRLRSLLDLTGNVEIYSSSGVGIEHEHLSKIVKTNLEINAIIIDSKILWYGGINPFVSSEQYDSIMRINDRAVVENLMVEIKR